MLPVWRPQSSPWQLGNLALSIAIYRGDQGAGNQAAAVVAQRVAHEAQFTGRIVLAVQPRIVIWPAATILTSTAFKGAPPLPSLGRTQFGLTLPKFGLRIYDMGNHRCCDIT